MVEPDVEISIRRQCSLLGISRSGYYHEPVKAGPEEFELMKRIDELHLRRPFYGSRRIAWDLSQGGPRVNRKRAQRLMRVMGIEGVAPQPKTSEPAPEHAVYPYLLRNLRIERVNMVWAADITYIPMAHGFAYLVAIIDWFSRRVLAWRLSNTMDTAFCVEALHEALETFGDPAIFNTDQGAQFTSSDFTTPLLDRGIKVSMDGRGRWLDNVFIERLWRSLKYEEVYLHAYKNLTEARAGIGQYMAFYNHERPHQALGQQPPAVFFALMASPDASPKGANSPRPRGPMIDIPPTSDTMTVVGAGPRKKATYTGAVSN